MLAGERPYLGGAAAEAEWLTTDRLPARQELKPSAFDTMISMQTCSTLVVDDGDDGKLCSGSGKSNMSV